MAMCPGSPMGIARVSVGCRSRDGHRGAGAGGFQVGDGSGAVVPVGVSVDRAGDSVAFDELALLASGIAEGGAGEAVGVAHAAEGRLVDHGDSVGGEELAVAADASETHADVFGGVSGSERV